MTSSRVAADGAAPFAPQAPHPGQVALGAEHGRGWPRSGAARGGGAGVRSAGPGAAPHGSVDGKTLYFIGLGERADNMWALSAEDGKEYPVTDLSGRYGRLEDGSLDTDREYLYFIWAENLGDIWVMDVVQE